MLMTVQSIPQTNTFLQSEIYYCADKFSFMLLGVDDSLQTNLVYGDEILKKTKQEKVLGVTLDNKRDFATHLLNITKNANKKFNALTRVQKYMVADQKSSYFSPLLNRNLPTVR